MSWGHNDISQLMNVTKNLQIRMNYEKLIECTDGMAGDLESDLPYCIDFATLTRV